MNRTAAIIGGGPAGLMAAEMLAEGGVQVDLYDAMLSPGRKFLLAGRGGLNLTHSEPLEDFLTHYGSRQRQLEPFLRKFGPDELRLWAGELGFETFVGSSGRVFPVGLKASLILRAWLRRLTAAGVRFHPRNLWLGWGEAGALRFATPTGEILCHPDVAVLALGGGSHPRLGSNGSWIPLLRQRGVQVHDLKPSNCGFDVHWSDLFSSHFEGQPVHPVTLSFSTSLGTPFSQKGEFIITRGGVEGSLIYAASSLLRDEIERSGQAVIHLDLAPDWSASRLSEKLNQPRLKRSLASHLKKTIGLQGVRASLLREVLPADVLHDFSRLVAAIKSLPVTLVSTRPLEEAISSAGGVSFDSLDERLMLTDIPGVFCSGEMLDWEAPTGGYLLTACFSTGRAAGLSALDWLNHLKA